MKILYFGTICNIKTYENLLTGCKYRPSVAPIVFESAILDGLYRMGTDVEIHSFPMIPTYPNSQWIRFGNLVEKLPCGYTCCWLNTINLPVLKQISRNFDARKKMKRWLKTNGRGGVILTYSIPPFLVKYVLKYAKRYGVKVVAIVPDLLRDMYINDQQKGIKATLKKLYLAPALRLQGDYDGYVYLTEAMREVVAPKKPYMVMEGIAESCNLDNICVDDKHLPHAIMYAGMLHEKYGIVNLLDALECIRDLDVQLWLFGDGTAVPEIKRRAAIDNRIKYFGTVSRQEILVREKQATLLINPRDPEEAFTEFSFPSKVIEYMLSGTPVVLTRLKGIPHEYFEYAFSIDGNSVAELVQILRKVFTYSKEELNAIGVKAQQFIVNNKSSIRQSARILAFLKEVQDET